MPSLSAHAVTLAYEAHPIVEDLSLTLQPGSVTSLVGPNGFGKSTLLRALTRLMVLRSGAVLLDGSDIHRLPTREVARSLGLLAQHAETPGGLTVVDLVRRGRFPHRGPWEPLGTEDERAVDAALARCGVEAWRDRPVDELSGGQRQRVWIALAVAQQTPVILMDEPTTFLDPEHQAEIMDLVRSLHTEGKTLILVLHDLVQAAAVSHRIVAMKAGTITADGSPGQVLTPGFLETMYGVEFTVDQDPVTGALLPRPRSRLDLGQPPCPRPGAPTLQARGVTAGYGGKPVIGPIDLTLGPGGFTVLLGPNGGGKSTLLRTLAGLHPALAGEVAQNGRPVVRLGGRQAALERAFLSQESVAPPGITVADLAGLGRFPHRGRWQPQNPKAVTRALEALGLAELAHRPVERLSGGQRQRVWLALALVQASPLVLLDEPTSFLDPGHQIELLDALWLMTREEPKTVVAILHDPELAARYADRVITLGVP